MGNRKEGSSKIKTCPGKNLPHNINGYASFSQTSSCITISLLCRTNCGQYLSAPSSILLYLTSSRLT